MLHSRFALAALLLSFATVPAQEKSPAPAAPAAPSAAPSAAARTDRAMSRAVLAQTTPVAPAPSPAPATPAGSSASPSPATPAPAPDGTTTPAPSATPGGPPAEGGPRFDPRGDGTGFRRRPSGGGGPGGAPGGPGGGGGPFGGGGAGGPDGAFAAPGLGAGEAEAPAVYKVSDKGYTINLQNSVVTDLLSFYQDLTGMTLIKDTAILEGPPVSLVITEGVDKAEAIRLVEATLLTNGYSVTVDEGGKSARIRSTRTRGSTDLQFSQGVRFYTLASEIPDGETIVSYFLPLTNLLPEDAGTVLANHVGLNVYGRITPVTSPPGLLITESASIVKHLISIAETIDVTGSTAALITKFIKLKFADATTVAQIVQATLTAQQTERESKGISTIRGQAQPEYQRSQNQGQPGQPGQPPQSSSSSSSSSSKDRDRDRDRANDGDSRLPTPTAQVVADPRLNQLLVVANAEDYTYISSLIEEFDKPVEVEEAYERKLNYAYAVDVLSSVADFLQDPVTTGNVQLPGGGTLAAGNRQVATSSAATLTGGRTTGLQRGGSIVGSSGTGVSDDGTGTSTASGGKADQLTAPEADNAPISVLVGKTRIIADPMSNTIIVMGPKESKDKAMMILDKLDRKPAQVYLATVIGQLSLGDGYNLGIDYFTQFNRLGKTQGFTSSLITANEGIATDNNITDLRNNLITAPFGPLKGFNVYGEISETIQGYVSALESTSRFKVLSRPSVFALNNKKAVITSGQQVPYPSQTITNSNNVGNVTSTVDYKDVVLKLEVVPLVNPNGEVTLTIAQVNDTIVGTQRIEPNDIPIIGTENLITTVTVPNGHTVVLGGLISEQNTRNTEGIPLVSRIPLLGNLFKENRRDRDRKELIIFIQPQVVEDESGLFKASHNEDIRTEIGLEAAKKFPQTPVDPEAAPADQAKKKGWLPRLIDRMKKDPDSPVVPR